MTNSSLRLLVLAGVLVLIVAALTGANRAEAAEQRVGLREQIERLKKKTWSWQRLMRVPRTSAGRETQNATDLYLEELRDLWRTRAVRAERAAQDPPHEQEWRCIHRHEASRAGGWSARTGNGYYGGLQMSMLFQRALAPELLRAKGTANNWTPIEQMWVAERAIKRGFGFTPWPNTARACGLL